MGGCETERGERARAQHTDCHVGRRLYSSCDRAPDDLRNREERKGYVCAHENSGSKEKKARGGLKRLMDNSNKTQSLDL